KEVPHGVVEQPCDGRPPRGTSPSGSVDRQRQPSRRRKTGRLELLAIELGYSERKIDAPDESCELPPCQHGEPEKARVVWREIGRRRDVVIEEHTAAVEGRQGSGHRRRKR